MKMMEYKIEDIITNGQAADTVEPLNRGHFGTAAFVLSSEVV